jgi:hypothetical protein
MTITERANRLGCHLVVVREFFEEELREAVAHEREECARLADDCDVDEVARLIRERGET